MHSPEPLPRPKRAQDEARPSWFDQRETLRRAERRASCARKINRRP